MLATRLEPVVVPIAKATSIARTGSVPPEGWFAHPQPPDRRRSHTPAPISASSARHTPPIALVARGSIQSGFNEVALPGVWRDRVARPHRSLQISFRRPCQFWRGFAPFFRILLVLLCHRLNRPDSRWQHGQRGRVRAMARAMATRTVVMEFGTWRSGRIGGSSGSITGG